MNQETPRTVCDLCRITDNAIVCDPGVHGIRLFREMTDNDARAMAKEIFHLRKLLAEAGPRGDPPNKLTKEIEKLEALILNGMDTGEDRERYKTLSMVYERYQRPSFQEHLLGRWAEAEARIADLEREIGR